MGLPTLAPDWLHFGSQNWLPEWAPRIGSQNWLPDLLPVRGEGEVEGAGRSIARVLQTLPDLLMLGGRGHLRTSATCVSTRRATFTPGPGWSTNDAHLRRVGCRISGDELKERLNNSS